MKKENDRKGGFSLLDTEFKSSNDQYTQAINLLRELCVEMSIEKNTLYEVMKSNNLINEKFYLKLLANKKRHSL